MKQDLNPATPNVCNNCVKLEKEPIDEITILIKCTSAIQKVIEEICINEGISFSEYFLRLHALNAIDKFVVKMDKFVVTNACPIPDFKSPVTDAKLPKGFGEVILPNLEESVAMEAPITPKKRGRPFKNS